MCPAIQSRRRVRTAASRVVRMRLVFGWPGFRGGVVQVHGLQERATIPHGLTTGDFTVGPVYGTRWWAGPLYRIRHILPELANLPLSLRPIRARRPSESGNRPSAAVSAPAGPRRAAGGPRSGNGPERGTAGPHAGPGAPGPPGPGERLQATNFYTAWSSGGREGAARARTGGPRGWGTRTARGGVRVRSPHAHAGRSPAQTAPRPRTKRGPWFEKISSGVSATLNSEWSVTVLTRTLLAAQGPGGSVQVAPSP